MYTRRSDHVLDDLVESDIRGMGVCRRGGGSRTERIQGELDHVLEFKHKY